MFSIPRAKFAEIISLAIEFAEVPEPYASKLLELARTARYSKVGEFERTECADGVFAGCPLTEIGLGPDASRWPTSWVIKFFGKFDELMYLAKDYYSTFTVRIED